MTQHGSRGRRSAAPLVGRGAELDQLLRALAESPERGTTALLVSGEPGVGKSRLIAEARQAAGADFTWLDGYALESGGMPPYFPLARALGPTLGRSDAARDDELRALLPVLAEAGIAAASGEPLPARLTPDAERLRLFEAITSACIIMSRARPLVIALDDLQWTEAATWEALVYLTRAAGSAPVLLILAVRDEALLTAGPIARAVAELDRNRILLHLPLGRLSTDDIVLLAGGVAGTALGPAIAAMIAQRSTGNPFFAEELTRDLLERNLVAAEQARAQPATIPPFDGLELPLTLRLAIGQRLDRLPQETRTALTVAAVFGSRFAEQALAGALGWSAERLFQALEPALAAGIVIEGAGEWSFAHDMLRASIYEHAGAGRRRIHAAVATELAAGRLTTDASLLATLAHHWQLAGEPAKAAAAALAASAAATAAHAPAEALAYARQACELIDHAGDRASSRELAVARLAAGAAALGAGEQSEADVFLRAALDGAQAAGDRLLEGECWLRLGVLNRHRELSEAAAGCLRAALALLEGEEVERPELVEALLELAGLEGMTRAHYEEAEVLCGRAVSAAGRLHLPALAASATATLADTRSRAGNPAAERPLLQRALEQALAADDAGFAAEMCARLANAFYWTGELRASREYGERRLQLAQRAGDPFGLRHAHSWLANLAWSRGEWELSRGLLRDAEPVLRRLDSPEPLAFLRLIDGMIDLRIGAPDAAYAKVSEAVELFERIGPATTVWYAGWVALACIELGRTAEAEEHVAAQERRIDGLPESALPARSARTLLALAYAALGERERGAYCEQALRPYAGDYHWSPARHSLAVLALLRGDESTARADLAIVEAQARREGLRPDLARALEARACLDGDERLRARDRAEAEGLLRSLGMRPVYLQPITPAASALPAGLTAREVDVLRLVSRGYTNRQIADALVISERTAINHLSHIFAKIAVENRAGAAAFALRHGLE